MRNMLGYPLYVNGKLFEEPVTISHVPGTGSVDPSMGAVGSYVAYRPNIGQSDLAPPNAAALAPEPNIMDKVWPIWRFLGPVAAAAGIYHGYARNQSILWGLWWGISAAALPVITIPIALAQGFGKRRGMTSNPGRRRRRKRKRRSSRR